MLQGIVQRNVGRSVDKICQDLGGIRYLTGAIAKNVEPLLYAYDDPLLRRSEILSLGRA